MEPYQNLYRKFLGFAFMAGPLLWFIGSLFMPLGNLGVGGMIAPFGVALLEDDDSLFAAMCAGARGYVLKGADKAEVLHTVTAVAEGQALFGPVIASRLTAFFQKGGQMEAAVVPFPELTDREREVLTLIAQGLNNSDIAARLHISGKTVSNHISSIFNKLQVADRAQAIVKAREAGID